MKNILKALKCDECGKVLERLYCTGKKNCEVTCCGKKNAFARSKYIRR